MRSLLSLSLLFAGAWAAPVLRNEQHVLHEASEIASNGGASALWGLTKPTPKTTPKPKPKPKPTAMSFNDFATASSQDASIAMRVEAVAFVLPRDWECQVGMTGGDYPCPDGLPSSCRVHAHMRHDDFPPEDSPAEPEDSCLRVRQNR